MMKARYSNLALLTLLCAAGAVGTALAACEGFTVHQQTYFEAPESLGNLKQASANACCSICSTMEECTASDGAEVDSGACLLSYSPGANVTELKGLLLGAGVEWTSGISTAASAALACGTGGGSAGDEGGQPDDTPAGACTWINSTLYTHIIEEPKELVGERVDALRNVESVEACCARCTSKPPCNSFHYLPIDSKPEDAKWNPSSYGDYPVENMFGTLFNSIEPGYCVLFKDPDVHSMVLDRALYKDSEGNKWVSGWVGGDNP